MMVKNKIKKETISSNFVVVVVVVIIKIYTIVI